MLKILEGKRNFLQFAMKAISPPFWRRPSTMRQYFSVPPFQTRGSSHTMENLLIRPAALARRSTWTNLIRICHSSSLTELADARMSATNSSRTKVSMGAVWARQVLLVTIVSIAITRTAASNQLPPEAAAAAEVGAEGLSWWSGFSTYPALKEVVPLRSLFYLHLLIGMCLNFLLALVCGQSSCRSLVS